MKHKLTLCVLCVHLEIIGGWREQLEEPSVTYSALCMSCQGVQIMAAHTQTSLHVHRGSPFFRGQVSTPKVTFRHAQSCSLRVRLV